MANWKPTMRKTLITTLTAAMLVTGSTAAFAEGKGKGRFGKDDDDKERALSMLKGRANLEIKIAFDDIRGGDVEWALRYIASLASKRVFEGYEDGTFKPRNVITRIEAITAAVRLMGLREQAESPEEMNSNLNFKDADKIRSRYPWAVGYVAVAAENDLFAENETSVQPEKEADRLWATTLLVKALKLDSEAKAKMNAKLPFKDANEIPAGSVGYVAVAVERGLINGYENNTFRPHKPVTRAELAALLDRTGAQMPEFNNGIAQGTVSATVNGDVLTIVKNGQSSQYTLHSEALILRGGVKVTAADLKVGDEVKIYFNNNIVTFVEVTKPIEENQDFSVDGKFHSLTINTKGEISTISVIQAVYGETQVSVYNVAADVNIIGNTALLVPGHDVQLGGRNNIVNTIEIK